MGICMPKELRDQLNANKEISLQLKKELVETNRNVKLLLLGPGESGKSTILKQMQILHKNGFSESQLVEFKQLIYGNTLQCMAILVMSLRGMEIDLDDPELEVDCILVKSLVASGQSYNPFSPELYLALKRLWGDNGIRKCYDQRHRLQLPDCAKHYFDSLDRINGIEYKPTNEDVLYTRVATTGVVQVQFDVKDSTTFSVIDVGGQRSERRKWLHVFDNVNAVIFLTAISEYDQVMREDENTNRLIDSLALFASTCNAEFFRETTFILFLNKRDLFEQKIQIVSLTVAFQEFAGEQTYSSSLNFIKRKFKSLNVDQSRTLIIHETCATDTDQVQHVIEGVIDTVISENLNVTGLA